MEKKESLGHQRALLIQTIMKKNLSENADLEISKIIKNTREKLGSEASDRKAKALRIMIENCKDEQEVLEKLEKLK